MSQLVVIASRNPVKMEAVRQAFESCFPTRNIRFEGVQVPSGVSDQPMTNEETRRGARQRAEAAQAQQPQADFWVGLEGGLETDGQDLRAFAWMVVASAKKRGEARTACFPLPRKVAALVREGKELGEADDIVFGQTNSKQQEGAVGLLTHGRITRTTYYREALILALVPFVQPALY